MAKKVGTRTAGGKAKPRAAPAVDYPALLQALARIVGPQQVHAHDAVCVAYASHLGAPRAVVLPRTADELDRVLEACRRAGAAVDTIWGKQVEKDVLLVDGVVVDTRQLARSHPPSVTWNYTHYGKPAIAYSDWGVR